MARKKNSPKAISNKTCKQIADLIMGYLNGELSARVRRDFEKHLDVCRDCVSFLNTYKKTIQTARSVDVATLPAKVRNNILNFLRSQIRRASVVVVYLIAHLAA